jgi:hypothetical protein
MICYSSITITLAFILFTTDRVVNLLNPFMKLEDLETWSNGRNIVLSLLRLVMIFIVYLLIKLIVL